MMPSAEDRPRAALGMPRTTYSDHSGVWRLIERATPPALLARVRVHMLVNPDKPMPAPLQRSIGQAWSRAS
jgi:hypothetical protein